jgi:hypothetical protein
MSRAIKVLLAIGVVLVTAPPASAQSAADVANRMMTEYERRMENVENYTLVQDAMGIETVSYFVKEVDNGRPVFRYQFTFSSGMGLAGSLDLLYRNGEELAAHAAYLGVSNVDDYDVHVLEISDFTGEEFAGMGLAITVEELAEMGLDVTVEELAEMGLELESRVTASDSEFTLPSVTFYLDVDTYALRRFAYTLQVENEDGVHPVTTTIDRGDYREVEGMLVAYRTVVRIEGFAAAMDPGVRAQFEEMQRELENMPPAQRPMFESMLADLPAMIAEMTPPSVTVQMLVREVRVNEGPPSN